MTVEQWEAAILARYGKWGNAAIKRDVFRFVQTKHTIYLSALFKRVIETRPPKFGPPSLADLMKLNAEAIETMELVIANKTMEADLTKKQLPAPDEEKVLSPEEARAEFGKALSDLRKKVGTKTRSWSEDEAEYREQKAEHVRKVREQARQMEG